MAGANMKDVRLRIKSVESTRQITKAMELVASSKLRRARANLEKARPYFDQVYTTMSSIIEANKDFSSPFLNNRKSTKKICYIIIAGDRGLAGGYNANVLKFALQSIGDKNSVVVPIGKKATEFFKKRNFDTLLPEETVVEEFGLSDCFELSKTVCEGFRKGKFDEIRLIYTSFVSMLSQQPNERKLLPLTLDREKPAGVSTLTIYDPNAEDVFNIITPQFIAGEIYGALCESFASEQGARRSAMENATDNADEMLTSLGLLYNRARQSAITQEITEIVAGANAQN